MAFPTTGILDSFDRADGAVGSNWTLYYTTSFNVSSNQLSPPDADVNEMGWTAAESGWGDLETYITIVTKSAGYNSPQITFRGIYNVTTSSYQLQVNPASNNITLVRIDADVIAATLASVSQTISNGDSVGISAIGSAIKVYYKVGAGAWTEIVSVTDATYSSGYLSLMLTGSSTQRCDNFGGGTYVAPASTATGFMRLGKYWSLLLTFLFGGL
jgi:hypothetical protein